MIMSHTDKMEQEKRKHKRYADIGRVDAPDVCIFPGMLYDISQSGCRIVFPMQLNVDMEQEYDIKITPTAEKQIAPFLLRVRPVWLKQTDSNSEIAFSLLPGPAAKSLDLYIAHLASQAADGGEDYEQLVLQPECQFV